MVERKELPSLNEFAWSGGIIYQVAFFAANVVLVAMRVPWLKFFHPQPADYFRIVIALVLVTFVMIYFAWFRHVRKFRESLELQPARNIRSYRALSDEEEAELRPGRSISLIAILYNVPASILNVYMLFNTPFAEL